MKVMDRAVSASDHTPWLALTYDQVHAVLIKRTALCQEMRLKLFNVQRKLSTLRRRIGDNQRLVMLLATNDVQRLQRLLSVALRKGASVRALISRIEDSLEGRFTPRGGFDGREIEVAFLAKALGGPRLLYALAHSHGLPSITTVGRQMSIPRLRPSISRPTEDEISANIASLCNPETRPSMIPPSDPNRMQDDPGARPTVAGLILMIDGVALEERCRYCSERNSIVGLCREHSAGLNTRVTSLDIVKKVEDALHGVDGEEPTCCYGKDGTVAAVAPYARTDHYTPVPILLSPSCKGETGEELADTLLAVIQVWRTHPFGEKTHGPLWALGSDGESSFRRARFLLCMTEVIDRATSLGRIVYSLRGFNCYTGPHGLVGTCDPKHVIKRFATLVRNPKGILIFETLLTSQNVFEHLRTLPGMTSEKARQLLDPADKQNVPKAINLLQSLLMLKETPVPAALPSQTHRQHVLLFLAQTLGFFFLPFISVNMTLSEQVRSLATYAHLTATLWIRHRTKFMTGALYADSQAIIKNIILTIARLQLVDSNLPFHIILEGTDRLEGLFGDCRTQDHSRNFDAQQLSEKLAISALIQGIFERNPDLDRGHRRLSLKDAMGVDHVNPRSWKASVRVGDVELAAEWTRGREEANKMLTSYFGQSARMDFDAIFRVDAGCDLLRPLGEYVGCNFEPDDLRTDAAESEDAVDSSQQEAPMACAGTGDHSSSDDDGGFDDEPEGIEVDDFLPSQQVRRPRPSATSNTSSVFSEEHFLMIDGKKYLKASVVTSFLTAKRSRKVTVRILRARGVTIEDLRTSDYDRFNRNDVDGADLVKCGDIAGALVRVEETVCLAVVEVLEIHISGDQTRRVTAVELEEMEAEDRHIKILVQVLEMRPVQDFPPAAGTTWLWDHRYAPIRHERSAPQGRGSPHSLLIPGPLLFPLGPSVVPVPSDSERQKQPETETNLSADPEATQSFTWALSDTQLRETLEAAWNALKPAMDEILHNIEQLPSVAKSDSLPYRDPAGTALLVQDIPAHLRMKKLDAKQKVPCLLCGKTLELSLMRNHVGHHILYSLRDVPDDVELTQEIGIEPCGFCGRADMCRTFLAKKGTSYKVASSCRYHYAAMSYAAACKTTSATPCTNVPIHCPFCPPQPTSGEPQAIWKYNAITHLLINHQDKDKNLPGIPPQFLVDMHISKAEEQAMGIEEDCTDEWREENEVPGSDDIQAFQEQAAEQVAVQKRGRAQSTTEVVGRRRKAVRTR
ncbi:hypothetical protein C2E23DRAFT_203440 [Lenzites betulinus]|nr:hypothetical protein C2E23DRAFT_203440 [Lenzites betulinus]